MGTGVCDTLGYEPIVSQLYAAFIVAGCVLPEVELNSGGPGIKG